MNKKKKSILSPRVKDNGRRNPCAQAREVKKQELWGLQAHHHRFNWPHTGWLSCLNQVWNQTIHPQDKTTHLPFIVVIPQTRDLTDTHVIERDYIGKNKYGRQSMSWLILVCFAPKKKKPRNSLWLKPWLYSHGKSTVHNIFLIGCYRISIRGSPA